MKMKLGEISISCKVAGTEPQPWGKGEIVLVYKYSVTVSLGKKRYATHAWGSRHDYENRKHDCGGISAMVVDELLMAVNDPDEFLEMIVQGGGTATSLVKRVKTAEKTIASAKKFGQDELAIAVEDAQGKDLL